MCGIAGIITANTKEIHTEQLIKMNQALHHRGPDGNALWMSDNRKILLAHNRLAIIDLSARAAQPMMSYDKRFVISYNGEVYNYQKLREDCIKLGSNFMSMSDTEVIIESYRHWGIKALQQFQGMWAFALYDRQENSLLLCRDPFGIKPLYYGFYDNACYFASEPKALRVVSKYFNEIDSISTSLFIEYGYLDRGDWTFFKNIQRFPHAHYALLNLHTWKSKLLPQRYWELPKKTLRINYQDAVSELKRLLIDSVKLHMRSDVALGSCLSGGIDSSAIVCIGNKIAGASFKTFTIHYPTYPEINEKHWAEQVIEYTQSSARYVEPTYAAFIADFDKVVAIQDEPFATTSIFAQHAIFKAIAASDVKVVLDGQGADEQFSGYLGFLPQFLKSLLEQKYYLKYFKESWLLARNYSLNITLSNTIADIVTKVFSVKSSVIATVNNMTRAELCDTLEERLCYLNFQPQKYDDLLSFLLCESNIPQLLRYEDRNSMAYSIESRVPFLESNLVEFVLNLPMHFKVRNGYSKSVLRDAMKDIIPRNIRLRINKLGFPTPEVAWLQQGFNIDPSTSNYNRLWREMITKRWQLLLNE